MRKRGCDSVYCLNDLKVTCTVLYMFIQKSGNFEPKKKMTFSLACQDALFAITPPTPQLKGFIQQLISFLEGTSLHIAPSIITCCSQVRIASMSVE